MKNKIFFYCVFIVCLSGCARLTELTRVVWGSSTRALEKNRDAALSQTYRCYLQECFDDVLAIGQENGYHVFLQSEKRNVIVFMNIPESIDTTEVGVFFKPLQVKETRLEVVSLSTRAKEAVAQSLFSRLDFIHPPIE